MFVYLQMDVQFKSHRIIVLIVIYANLKAKLKWTQNL